MTEDEVIERLRAACTSAGGQKAFAKLHSFGPAFISDVLNRKRGPSERLLTALGFERVVTYRKKRSVE